MMATERSLPETVLKRVRVLDVASEHATLAGDLATHHDAHEHEDDVVDHKLGTSGPALQAAVLGILQQLIPAWSAVTSPSSVHLQRVSGALTNCVYIVSYISTGTDSFSLSKFTTPPKVLLRVYGLGVDRFIRRERELVFFIRLSRSGVGPRLLGCFLNGRFEEFVPSTTLTSTEMRRPETADLVAAELCKFNALGFPKKAAPNVEEEQGDADDAFSTERPVGPIEPLEITRLKKMMTRTSTGASYGDLSASFNTLPGSPVATLAGDDNSSLVQSPPHRDTSDDDEDPIEDATPEIWERVNKWYSLSLTVAAELIRTGTPEIRARVESIGLDKYGEELEKLKERLEKVESPVVFGHNDLQYGNILRRGDGSLLFVDYEYAGYTFRGADIANHFCDHSDVPHFLDYLNKYPTLSERRRFVEAYIDAQADLDKSPRLDGERRRMEVDNVVREAEEYAQLAHLHWGFWGILQAIDNPYSGAPGEFDNLEYGIQRFKEYERRKLIL
ncbi:hypothetical protein HDU93_002661 [Gonapodya sp. JEL0774]|nr:hypothetical protein HDU93_002661 [Gonapodya sp. JEL0774]